MTNEVKALLQLILAEAEKTEAGERQAGALSGGRICT